MPHPTDLGRDELALPHFEERLWAELRGEHARAVAASPGPARRTPASRRARRSLTAAAIAAAVAAGVVATAMLVPIGRDGAVGPSARPPAGDPVDVETQVIGAIDEALASSIVHGVQENATSGDSEAWFDESTGTHRLLFKNEDGSSSYDDGMARAPGVDDPAPDVPNLDDVTSYQPDELDWPMQLHRIVDYCFNEYAELEVGALGAHSEAGRIRDGLADGSLVIEGTDVIDGRELLSVVRVSPPPHDGPGWSDERQTTSEPAPTPTVPADPTPAPPPSAPPQPDIRTYVDPGTYRPVMVRGYVGTDAEYTQTISYLPRTPENLALLVPPVPDGFVQVPELRGDRDRFEAGCDT